MAKKKTSLNIELFEGFHDPFLTEGFVESLVTVWEQNAIGAPIQLRFTTHSLRDACSKVHSIETQSDFVLVVGFSAGVISAAIATSILSARNKPPVAFIAVDGWGVPLQAPCPIYRFSHDVFTHVSSQILGGHGQFFADPPVSHLQMWANPQQVNGWFVPEDLSLPAMEMSAAEACCQIILNLKPFSHADIE